MAQKWREIPGSRKRLSGVTFCEGAKRKYAHVYGHYKVLEESKVDGITEVREREIRTLPIYAKDLPLSERVLLESAVAAAKVFKNQLWRNEEDGNEAE